MVVADWLVPLIAAAGAVAGSAVTGAVVYRVARLEREAADKGELRSALAAYSAAIDRLTLKIHQLPQAHGIEEGRSNKLIARWRTLDWSIGRLSVATIGRSTMRVVDEVIVATNRLILVAPEPIVEAMQAISDLIGRFEPASEDWKRAWQEARNVFAEVSRGAAFGPPSSKTVSRNMSPTPPNSAQLD
jgi:hypothetical protein